MNWDNFENLIISEKKVEVLIYSVESEQKFIKSENRYKTLTIAKVCEAKSRKHLFCMKDWNNCFNNAWNQALQNKEIIEFVEVKVKLDKEYCYVFDWDDVNDGKCYKSQIGQLETKLEPGKLFSHVMHDTITIYVSYINEPGYTREEFLQEVQNICIELFDMHYRTLEQYGQDCKIRAAYQKKQELERRKKEQEELARELEYLDNVYERYLENDYSSMDMSEEDRIMDALENGDAEKYGF